jgi:hypothetical protein
MTDNTYNGWTNYATWRVNLEMFDGATDELFDHCDDVPAMLREYAENLMEETANGLALDYAMAFLADVNWHEIAKHIKAD